jgi:hypothetical protein
VPAGSDRMRPLPRRIAQRADPESRHSPTGCRLAQTKTRADAPGRVNGPRRSRRGLAARTNAGIGILPIEIQAFQEVRVLRPAEGDRRREVGRRGRLSLGLFSIRVRETEVSGPLGRFGSLYPSLAGRISGGDRFPGGEAIPEGSYLSSSAALPGGKVSKGVASGCPKASFCGRFEGALHFLASPEHGREPRFEVCLASHRW